MRSVDTQVSKPEAPPLLIGTPFGIGVRDRAWFEHRVLLTSAITAPSLLSQDDQMFFWAIFTDFALPSGIRSKLNELIEPFAGRAVIYDDREYNSRTILSLAREKGAVCPNGRLFTARIDDDDAWHKRTVGMARRRVSRWSGFSDAAVAGFGFTFECGLEWIMYDMVDVDVLQRKGRSVMRSATVRPFPFPFLGTSVFVVSGPERPLSAISAGHARMGEVLTSRHHHVEVVTTDQPMWLYCRHKQAESALQKARASAVSMTVGDLVADFGLDGDRTARYLESSSEHQYVVVKRIKRRRGQMAWRLKQLQAQLEDPSVDAADVPRLQQQQQEISDEMAQVSDDLLGSPDDLLIPPGPQHG